MRHGVYVGQQPTALAAPIVSESGVPFFIACAPIHTAERPAPVGVPILCTDWAEAVERFGYSDDFAAYGLSAAMYSHFKLYGRAPMYLCNVLDPASHKSSVPAADVAVVEHRVELGRDAIANTLVIKAQGGSGAAYTEGVDYAAHYTEKALVVELLEDGAAYSASQINVAYTKITPESVDKDDIAMALDSIDQCIGTGIIPDLIIAPGFSSEPEVAAVMAAKAKAIAGLFPAKAIVDIASPAGSSYTDAIAAKAEMGAVHDTQIALWPSRLCVGEKIIPHSILFAGLIAKVDGDNDGVPMESPSNKSMPCTGAVLEDGSAVSLTLAQANILNGAGIGTALQFMGRWAAWGNYTACYPANIDPKDIFIPNTRMFGWIASTVVRSIWGRVDAPLSPRLLFLVQNTMNLWLNGLVGRGKLLGGRVEIKSEENPVTDLVSGILRVHIYLCPYGVAQEIAFTLELDTDYLSDLFS